MSILNEIIRPLADEMLKRAEMPKNKQIAENRTRIFWDELKSLNFEYGPGGKILVKDNKGFPIQDKHGWDLEVNEAIKLTFDKYFEATMPTNESEYISMLKNPKITPSERIKLTEFWQNRK